MTQSETYLLSLLSGIVVSLLTALVTVRLSLARFRSERIWERKLDAYLRILESLHKVKRYCKSYVGASELRAQLTSEYSAELNRDYLAAFAEIERASDIGLLLLPLSVVDDVKTVEISLSEMEESVTNVEAMKRMAELVEECLCRLREAAKVDMGKSL